MEKSLIENFNENYKVVLNNVQKAALKSGRNVGDVTILAATKTVPAFLINHAVNSGITNIGENRVQEFLQKENDILPTAHRHFIGHLQTNKVKDIVGKVELIQSVDSIHLAQAIAKRSNALNITSNVLAEINIGMEQSKSGVTPETAVEFALEISEIKGINLCGIMAIPPICDDISKNIQYFDKMYKLFVDIRAKKRDNNISILSMGMSSDYSAAIECGATMVRIGTALFGKRNYN